MEPSVKYHSAAYENNGRYDEIIWKLYIHREKRTDHGAAVYGKPGRKPEKVGSIDELEEKRIYRNQRGGGGIASGKPGSPLEDQP